MQNVSPNRMESAHSSNPRGRRPRLARSMRVFALALGVVLALGQKSPAADALMDDLAKASDVNAYPHGWPAGAQAPSNAPNVVVIMTDDVGFAASSTFGGPVPTPTFDALARDGLRYNNFHTTALCSPTRASLLTGRNPHHIGMADVTDLASHYDGYTSVIPKSAASIAEILKDNGYSTGMFGKSHLTPVWEMGPTGPFDHWPTGLGFEYFFGFLAGDTNQYAPDLVENVSQVLPPAADPTYILDRDLADRAVNWIRVHHALAPSKPYFIYYATGSAHGPQQAPKEWIAKFKGRFDQGWDKVREETFARQKAAGVIPKSTKLTPRPPELPAWDSLSTDQKRLYRRFMEVFAAQLAYADTQIGRVIDAVKATGQFNNTLIVFIQGDNGPSAEGGPKGKIFEQSLSNRAPEDLGYAISHIDDMGGPNTYEVYPAGWAWAMATPFQFFKQVASHFGGTANGMVISWPARIKDAGGLRQQFSYVSDVTPTILEAVGIAPPSVVNGVSQLPMDGVSLAYSFDAANAAARRQTQYFEMVQNVAIYNDGWVAATHPAYMPWELLHPAETVSLDRRKWELYNVANDFSEYHDLSAENPQKLKELQRIFLQQAALNNVLPVHAPMIGGEDRPRPGSNAKTVTYYPGFPFVYADSWDRSLDRSFSITADVDVPESGGSGVMIARGSRFVGYSFYLKEGHPTFYINAVPPSSFKIDSDRAVSPGHHILIAEIATDTHEPGSAATITLKIDGTTVGQGRASRTPTHYWWLQGIEIGKNLMTPVSDDYKMPAEFTGNIRSVTVSYE